MFSEKSKKTLIYVIVIVVAILLGGLVLYKYAVIKPFVDVKNTAGGAQTEQTPETILATPSASPQPKVNIQHIPTPTDTGETLGKNGDNGFSVCANKCGDGICQKEDSGCDNANNLNCACPETPQECPQDCEQAE